MRPVWHFDLDAAPFNVPLLLLFSCGNMHVCIRDEHGFLNTTISRYVRKDVGEGPSRSGVRLDAWDVIETELGED